MGTSKINHEELIRYYDEVLKNPIEFAKTLRSPDNPEKCFVPYDYQEEVLKEQSKRQAWRFGRQTGKTICLIAKSTYGALREPNQMIIIITPGQKHLQRIIELFNRMVRKSIWKNHIVKVTNSPEYRIEWANGSVIFGQITGEKGVAVKGNRADELYVDECFSSDTKFLVATNTGRYGIKEIKDIRPGDSVYTLTTAKDVSDYSLNLTNLSIDSDQSDTVLQFTNNPEISANIFKIENQQIQTTKNLPTGYFTKVKNILKTGKKQVYLFKTESGRSFKVTPEHKIVKRDGSVASIIECNEIGIFLNQYRSFIANKPVDLTTNYKKLLEASIYGVLFSGYMPADYVKFMEIVDSSVTIDMSEIEFEPIPIYGNNNEIVGFKDTKFRPISEHIIPSWIKDSKDYATEFLASFITCHPNGIPYNKFIYDLIGKYFNWLVINDGQIDKDCWLQFATEIGFRFDENRNNRLICHCEYIRSGSTMKESQWIKERIYIPTSSIAKPPKITNLTDIGAAQDFIKKRRNSSQVILFEKIVAKIPIGIMETYSLETSNHYCIANGFVSHNCDFISDAAWGEIIPITNSNPNMRMIISSTPAGIHGTYFWKVFNDPSFSNYYTKWVPANKSGHWTPEQELNSRKDYPNPQAYLHNVMAEFGDQENTLFINSCIENSFVAEDYRHMHNYFKGLTILSVDWNGSDIGVVITILRRVENSVVLPFCKLDRENKDGPLKNKITHTRVFGGFAVIYKEVVKQKTDGPSEIQMESINRIIELKNIFNVKSIYTDAGYGHTQLELLHIEGVKRNDMVLINAMGIHGNKIIKLKDPITMVENRKDAKQLFVTLLKTLINSSCLYFSWVEDNLNILNPNYGNKETIGYEIRNFSIISRHKDSVKYSKDYDHFISAIGFGLLGYLMDYDPNFKEFGIDVSIGGQSYVVEDPDRLNFMKYSLDMNESDNIPSEESGIYVRKHKNKYLNRNGKLNSNISRDITDEPYNQPRNPYYRNIPRRDIE